MNTVVIQTNTKSDIRFFMDLSRRMGVSATTINTDEIVDANLAALIEKGLKTPNASRSAIMNALS